jgi:uncharacterized membrane protein YsdA (DUF1294 family)
MGTNEEHSGPRVAMSTCVAVTLAVVASEVGAIILLAAACLPRDLLEILHRVSARTDGPFEPNGRQMVALVALGVLTGWALVDGWRIPVAAYRTVLALDAQRSDRGPRLFRADLRAARWFLLLPAAVAIAWCLRPALANAPRPESPAILASLSPVLSWLPEYLAFCLAASAHTILLYGDDKYRAIERRTAPDSHRRIPEWTLHRFELAGGWPGALAAQRALRHKTSDTKYRLGFYLMVALHFASVLALIGLWHRIP